MCKYCGTEKEVIETVTFSECKMEVFIDGDNTLAVNTYEHSTGYTEDICENFKINFCPMCGMKLI